MPKVLFRCDSGSSPEVGTGHIYRCINLANKLIEKKIFIRKEIFFLTRNDANYLFGKMILKKKNFNFKTFNINKNNTSKEAEHILQHQPNLVIIDRLKTSKSFIKKIKSQSKVITFDDYGSGRQYCDLAINAIFSDVKKNQNTFRGYKYLILNIKNRNKIKIVNKIKNVFISFGGYDKRNLLNFVLKNIDLFPKSVKFKIVVSDFLYNKVIKNLKLNFKENFLKRLYFLKSPKNYSKIFSSCDLTICSGGLTLFESCSLGIPTVALPQNMHQYKNIKKLFDKKSVILGSNFLKKDHNFFRKSLAKLIYSQKIRKQMSDRSKKLIDLNGVLRISELIKKIK